MSELKAENAGNLSPSSAQKPRRELRYRYRASLELLFAALGGAAAVGRLFRSQGV